MSGDIRLFSEEAEQSVLGSCLTDPDVLVQIAPLLQPGDFFRRAHGLIWTSMMRLYEQRIPPDLVLVCEDLAREGQIEDVGSEVYLAELIGLAPIASHAHHYVTIVQQFSKRRQMLQLAREIARDAGNQAIDVERLISSIEGRVADAVAAGMNREAATMEEIAQHYLDTFHEGPGPLIEFGIPNLDDFIGGIPRKNLVVIASRPSMGKSSLATHLVLHNANLGKRVIFLSLEMGEEEYMARALSSLTMINSRKIAAKSAGVNGDFPAVEEMAKYLGGLPIVIDTHSSGDLLDVIGRVRRLHAHAPADLVVVDHMGLMSVDSIRNNRVQEMSAISRGMKRLAMELECPVFALHQLSRANSQRKDPTPILTDLRDSGSVEQDGDIVLFLHREGYYKLGVDPEMTQLAVAKYRNGPVGAVTVRFDMRHNRFSPYRSSHVHHQQPKEVVYVQQGAA